MCVPPKRQQCLRCGSKRIAFCFKIPALLFETYAGRGNDIHETIISTLQLSLAAFSLSCRSGQPPKQHGKERKQQVQNPSGPMATFEATGIERLKAFAEDAKRKRNGMRGKEGRIHKEEQNSRRFPQYRTNGWLLEGFRGRQRSEEKKREVETLVSYRSLLGEIYHKNYTESSNLESPQHPPPFQGQKT